MVPKIVCFGETLWDIFPDKKVIGGAPLNVALRLHSLGDQVRIISSIGNDVDGENLLAYLKEQHLSTDAIQMDAKLPTGNVQVHLDSHNTASYTISEPVAWDHITISQDDIEQIQLSDAFIYGSLSCRKSTSKNTLLTYLSHAKFKVFDANLRTPFYTLQAIVELMNLADLIKLNDEELEEISQFLGIETNSIEGQITQLAVITRTDHICITLGANGAIMYTNSAFYRSQGYKVVVKDTVGAGDSFLATLIHQFVLKIPPQTALDFSCAMGSLVASKNGANAYVSSEEISIIQAK
ncbi:carbohydrate kinase [Lutimonas halocynthiae]|uniref:carbohydrate kinase family protein n=1 Tax=Lutimonas halocynthiae TaxID=1446477 RepID=UPI0025B60134|nr:carbohydrate kinase [Lutimonas halocynthiae]MDN3643549.1 carbohydrate kinase [Lutimonas halocynthiae]